MRSTDLAVLARMFADDKMLQLRYSNVARRGAFDVDTEIAIVQRDCSDDSLSVRTASIIRVENNDRGVGTMRKTNYSTKRLLNII
jgi:hypothetical protein